ncbi:MAG: T9SS type A sorting domain-containing protein [Desulfobulbaceae bacterium]|nr:T9SS type A sorting domain-containing protein [Desulfobulbaceae bacterium]
MKKYLILVVIMCYTFVHVIASNPEWVKINDLRTYNVTFLDGNIWYGNEKNGLTKINLESGTSTIFNSSNSPIPNGVSLFAFDEFKNIWLPRDSFFLVYDNQNWTKVNYDFYNLIENDYDFFVQSFAIDKYNNKWLGSAYTGLFKFNDTEWKRYSATNSELTGNWVRRLFPEGKDLWINSNDYLNRMDIMTEEITPFLKLPGDEEIPIWMPEIFCKDTEGKIWIFNRSTYFLNYDGENWNTLWIDEDIPIKNPYLMSMAIDKNNKIWGGVSAATDNSGIIMYDGTDWNFFKYDVEKFWAYSIAVDDDNHKWFGTAIGLYVYREGGVSNDILSLTSVEDSEVSKSNGIILSPNPATEYIEINATINPTVNRRVDEGSEIKIFNTLGECVLTVETIHELSLQRIDISHLPRGVYYLRIGSQTQMFVKI